MVGDKTSKSFFFWERQGTGTFILFRAKSGEIIPVKEFTVEAEVIAECKRLAGLSEEDEFGEFLRLGMSVISERLWGRNGKS